ncbi:Kiwa anti-phage protein KwaB-like domain-containing protein [Haloarchaeobius sp. DFWS5]|uniref:Kiwa anti-phage protein KwaB-like domain-containing protein n=1 Tax=Haloarchaeobius sp. DFWS5 TaxID=3446114 RepID=UPI003EBC280A
MVSDREAKNMLQEAKEVANCDPEEYYRDFLLVRSSDNSEEENDVEKVGFHSDILTELNINLTNQIQYQLSALGESDEEDDDDVDPRVEIKEYDVENLTQSPRPVQYIEEDGLGDEEHFRSVLNDLTISDETDFTRTDNIQFQVFRVKNNIRPELIAFRDFTTRQIIGSSYRVKIATFGNQEYDKLKENPVALPDTFDVVYYDGVFFIFNHTSFERLFNYFENYEEDADEIFEYLVDSEINIADMEKVEQTVRNSRSGLRKMREIKNRGKYQDVTQERAETLISESEDVSLKVETEEDGTWQLRVTDFRKVGEILQLLNDDFVVSGLDIIADEDEEDKYIARGGKDPR